MKRAAICIGVNRAGTMRELAAAARGAADFAAWAESQGCEVELLTDDEGKRVTVADIFDAVSRAVAKNCHQLIVYFAGHGILQGPGVEYWLLSRAPQNPNEAVNLFRSIEDARNCRIPHVIFISDACRSYVNGPPLSGIIGGTIFPPESSESRGEIDVFYATRPGDPSWELPAEQATQKYKGVFTEALLSAIREPGTALVDRLDQPVPRTVVTSRKLKPHLESIVPEQAADFDIRIRQIPEVRVETALPAYFAVVDDAAVLPATRALDTRRAGPVTMATALSALDPETRAKQAPRERQLGAQLGLQKEVDRLIEANQHQQRVRVVGGEVLDIRMSERAIVVTFQAARLVRGAILANFRDFRATVVIDESGRVVSVSWVPDEQSYRFFEYRQNAEAIEKLRAIAAVSAREGRFDVPKETAAGFAARVRQGKGLDPSLGIYAAYAYALAGRYADVHSVYEYMRHDRTVPFDVAMLATRYMRNRRGADRSEYAPEVPMLSQGWALLAPGDPMHADIHELLRPHLVPALWTTLTEEGIRIVVTRLKMRKRP
jgi:Caspase domain